MLAWPDPASAQAQPRLIVLPTELEVGEGDSVTYTVHFDSNPSAFEGVECGEPVYVSMRGYDYLELDVAPSVPAFKTGDANCEGGNWDSPRTIRVSPLEHDWAPRETVTIKHAVWDNAGGTPLPDTDTPQVTVTIYDDDPAGKWVSIEPGDSPFEGGSATFTLKRGENDEDGSPMTSLDLTQPLTVSVSLSETGNMLSGSRSKSVTFAADEATKDLEVETADDEVDEDNSTIRATIGAPSGHTIAGRAWATVEAKDDDGAVFGVSANPDTIEEGASSTLNVSITNGVTFADNQTIELDFTGSTAVKDTDFRVSPATVTLRAGQSQVTATITAVDDEDHEAEPEKIRVAPRHEGRTFASTLITIEPSDLDAPSPHGRQT